MALSLTSDERSELERRVRSRKIRAEDARRAQVILMLAAGESFSAIKPKLRSQPSAGRSEFPLNQSLASERSTVVATDAAALLQRYGRHPLSDRHPIPLQELYGEPEGIEIVRCQPYGLALVEIPRDLGDSRARRDQPRDRGGVVIRVLSQTEFKVAQVRPECQEQAFVFFPIVHAILRCRSWTRETPA